MDCLIVVVDGTVVTRRVHAAVMICVKTGAILGAILALDTLKEEDYMRLLKQTLEPKERLVAFYGCQFPWPCSAKPDIIVHDRGKIFTSERATHVIVDRMGIMTEQAPAYAPSAKGTVESLFTWVTRKLTHRLPGTTKSSPQARGIYDSAKEAEKAGITFDVLEQLFYQAIVDGYMQEWDTLRRQTRLVLWNQAVEEMGVNRWMGSPDDLKLLLMKAVNRKNPATGRYAIHPGQGLSFLGRRYVSPGLLNRLRGQEIDIYYDRRDLAVIYLSLQGELVGEAYCTELMGQRVSIWEAQAMRAADTHQARAAEETSKQNRQRIQKTATSGKKALAQETKRLELQRLMNQQRDEIHPSQVAATLQALEQYRLTPAHPPLPAPSLSPAVPDVHPRLGRLLPTRKRGQEP